MEHPLAYIERGSRALPSLILLHGFMGSKDDWDEVMDRLEEHYHCIAIDLPGHGESLLPEDSFAYTFDGLSCEILKLMRQLMIEQVDLLAYSMGGRLAYHLILHHPQYFRHAFIESASPGIRDDKERKQRLLKDLTLADRLENEDFGEFLKDWYAQEIFSSLAGEGDLLEGLIKRRLQNDPTYLAIALRAMTVGNQTPLWDILGSLSVPVVQVAGALDSKYCEIVDEVSACTEYAQKVVLEGLGHNAHFENTDAFCGILKTENLWTESLSQI
ncbi:Putative 2-succinyl-6-hydroxy-2,4-cyclohexadiene-1-carboxylate synthase [Chlamydiales bacterium SCGC AG-110-M15]|nr:Putative 2-succinyl-6-hydroxy-2,4-cyclohexadiene-1-carboxylate synthase [Chlamydiales bacterium SCGC AG-110-M15]